MPAAVVADAEGALKAYVNSLTLTLVGVGKPLALGMWLGDGPRGTDRPRAPQRGAYGVLSRVGGNPRATDAAPWDWPRLSASIYGVTRQQALTAAAAYANELLALDGAPVRVEWTGPDDVARVVTVLVVDSITGPLWVPDNKEPRYTVDAIVVCTPA